MKIDWKYGITQMLVVTCILIINHLMDYFIDLGYGNIITALLKTYFIATAGIFLGLWNSRYYKKNLESKEK